MAKLSSKKRDQLKDSDFGIPEKRMYPLHDKAHIESAVKLFGHAETKYKKSLAQKILRRAKEYNMDTSGWKQVLSFAQEAVPPMSNGTSLGNIPPGLTAPYEYSEGDELMSRVNSLGNTDMFTFAKSIVNEIHAQVEKDSKPPTGNQNCQLCTWCAEARFRGMNVLPRPIYSPRDPALAVPGENIVMNPVKEKIATQRQVIETVRGAVNSRWYVHVNWKDSTGGHEFLVVNINDYAYLLDAQAGMLKEIDETDSTDSYFRDINYANSYMVRLDTKKFNTELFNEMNDPSKVLPWNPELDVPYMKEHGMLGDMSDKWTMRPATEADLEFVYFSELETVGENKNDPKVQKYIREDAKESLGHTQIIVAENSDIGVYQAYATDYYGLREGKKDWWYLAHIYIKPEYRTLGIGSAIIKRDIAEHDKILLQVMKSNTRAKKLYESLGFVVDMENDHGGLVMRLDKSKPVQEQMLDGIGAATGDEEHKIPVKCPDNMSRDEKIFYRALFGEFDSSMQMDNMIEKIIWPFAQKEGLAQNAYNKLYEYCHHKKKDDATLDDIEDNFEHFDYVWGFLFPPASGEVVSATKAYIVFDSDCTYLDKSDQTRPKGYVQFKLEITLKNNKDFFAQMVSPKTGNVVHYMTLHMKDFGDYMDERDIKKQMEQLSKEKVIEAMPEDMRRFIESINDPKFYHYPMEETGIEKVGNGLWIFDKDTIASDFLIAFKYLPEVKKLSEWGDWNKKLEILEKTPVKKLTVAVSDDIGDLYIVYDLSSGKLKETWNGKVIANSWKEFESKLKQESFTQEGAFQDLKNGVNPYSDDLVFHVSPDKHIDGQVWKPRVPDYLDPYNPEDTGFEDNTTPRICFSTSIEGCLNGITVNLQRQSPDTFDKMYVYVPEKPWKEYKHKTNKQLVKDKLVYDANVTREVWIMEPVRMKLYGVIRVDQIADAKRKSVVPTSKGQKDTRNYFTYKWHWVVKPKVLKKATKFDYSPERVIDDLCIDIKKFKYGLIKDGRLMTGNVSDKDYDKYWVFHSGETVDQAGGGNCYDMVEYEAGYLEAFGVTYKKYFMNFTKTDGKTPVNTHTICVVPLNGKFVYIEQAFKRVVDEWGHERKKEFDKLNDVFEYVAEVSAEYDNQDLNYGVWDYTNAEIDYGTPIKNFMEWIMTKCKMVYDGEASKPKSIKEGFKLSRFNSTRFYQEEEEYLSEDITVGDIDLDDEKDNPEDIQTDETSVTRNTPEKVETSEEKEEAEEPEEIEPIENFEDIDIGSDEVPEYMKDRLSEEDKKEFESDDNNEMDVNNVELGSFGSDTSDVQNDYDQKEVDILMKLMASEADAMNEYMDGAKETNVDVLRRLYADIANEERFHMEQLLFAKSELTGERYIPRDPDVKSEYEELLKMGMDENTAMQTAVDKCHIRGISVSVDNDVDEMKETQEEVETLEYAVEMFAENFDSFMKEFEMSDREKSIDKFVQEYLAMEAVTPEGKEVHKGLELGRNPITVLMKAADFVIRLLVELCRKIKVFLDRVKRSSANFKNYVQQIKMDPNGWKTFFEPIMLYFMPHYDSLNGKRVAIMPREMYQWYMLAYDTVVECGKGMNININIQPDAIAQQYRTQNINGDIKQGAEMLNSIHLSREPMVKPADDDARNELIDMFMGYSDIIGEDGKSYNMLGSYQKFADIWRELLKQTEAMMKALVSAQNQVNENPQLRNTYELCMTGLNAVIKSSKAFAAAITKDINTIIKLDSDVYEAVRNKDNKRIEENEVAKNQNQAYKDRFGKVRNMNDANPPK